MAALVMRIEIDLIGGCLIFGDERNPDNVHHVKELAEFRDRLIEERCPPPEKIWPEITAIKYRNRAVRRGY